MFVSTSLEKNANENVDMNGYIRDDVLKCIRKLCSIHRSLVEYQLDIQ